MANEVTLTPETLQQVIASAVAEAMAQRDAKLPNPFLAGAKPAKGGSDKIDAAVVRAFKRAGFDNVIPRADVKTFNLWANDGFRPKEGEKSIRVRQFRLFHRSQLRPLTAAEKAAFAEKSGTKATPAAPTPTAAQPSLAI